MDFSAALLGSLSHDQRIREEAAKALEEASSKNFAVYMRTLGEELINESRDGHVRVAAGIALKNSLVAKDYERRRSLEEKWIALDAASKFQIKHLVVQGLSSKSTQVGTAAAQAVSGIAFIELPRKEWPELFSHLLANVTSRESAAELRRATLEAIGFVCEQIDPAVLESLSSEILTAVINGLRQEETNAQVRIAAAKALLNSVDFIRRHFDNPTESTIIMQVVCEATTSTNEGLAVAAFECLNEIVTLYYERMGPFVGEGIAQMAIGVLERAKVDSILLQAIEFWSGLSEAEQALEEDAEAAGQEASDSFYFVKRFASSLLPPLLNLLTQQPSEDAVDDWCPPMAASTCLALLASCLKDSIMEGSTGNAIKQFIEMNLVSSSWRGREAAVMALGSILDGPSYLVLGDLVRSNLVKLVELLANDSSVAVQDSAAWTIGKVCDFHLEAIEEIQIPLILQVLTHCLTYAPRVAVNCCWSLMTLCIHLGAEDTSLPTSPVSPLLDGIVKGLLMVADRTDGEEHNLASAAYQSLAAVLLNAPMDCIPLILSTQELIVGRLEASLGMMATQVVNADDRNRLIEIQSHLCAILQSTIKKASAPSPALADRSMQVALSIFQTASTASGRAAELEDVLLLVGVLATELEGDFVRFLNALIPFLVGALSKYEEVGLCTVAVGLVGDLARALGVLLLPHCDALMTQLVQGLQASHLDRSVKPHIISAIGDVALAVGSGFSPYLNVTMGYLCEASAISVTDPKDYEMVDFVVGLREALLEAFTCTVQGFRQDGNAQALTPYLGALIPFLQAVANDPERTETMVRSLAGLIGDLTEAFRPQLGQGGFLRSAWLLAFFQAPFPAGIQPSQSTEATLRWAHQLIQS